MGWKNVKTHYNIDHFVCVTKKGICIGSGYVHDIIVISDGVPRWNSSGLSRRQGDKLDRYLVDMEADTAELRRLIDAPDTFVRSLPVFTYDYDGNIIKKQCESYGWPNVTHDGCMMYDNQFFADRDEAVRRAKLEMAAWISNATDQASEAKRSLDAAHDRLCRAQRAAEKLIFEYPHVMAEDAP